MPQTDDGFDWREVARLALISRRLDELEEETLVPNGQVTYQFSARGHELGQLLLAQRLGRRYDAAGVYYRSRPFMLAVGLTPEEALAADMARADGISGGRDVGVVFNLPWRGRATVLPASGDVGSQYTPAAGWAQAIRYRADVLGDAEADGCITLAFGGDGSVAGSGFWAALNMATTLSLPLLFVIEDNGYAISVAGTQQVPGGNIARNLASYGNLAVWDGSGTDPAETAAHVAAATDHVRGGQGPGLLRLTMPRLSGHSSVDNQAYKSAVVLEAERARDPLVALETFLVPGVLSPADWQALRVEADEVVARACVVAQARPEPMTAEVTRFVFSEPDTPQAVGGLVGEGLPLPAGSDTPVPDDPRRINFVDAVRRVLESELERNPRLLCFGEDVGVKGGVHAATLGLQKRFGERRVFDTSLSEEGIIGRAVGMALAGLVPVPEIQFRKYADPATEQLHNCGTLRWRTHNTFAAPIIVRMPGGFRKIGDPWHSVTSEIDFAHAVGWKVAFPSNAADGAGLLRAALRGNDPVIFFEHRAVLDAAWSRRPYPGDDYELPFGRGAVLSEGDDLTVVTWGAMVERCAEAAAGLDVTLIDLRTIQPWDKELVLEAVRQTAKLLIVHEDVRFGGFGAEIAATVADEAFMDLDGPIRRVAAPQVPVPFNVNLMDAMLPTVADIRAAMEALIAF